MTAYSIAMNKKRDTILPYLNEYISPRGNHKEAIRDGNIDNFTALLEQPKTERNINEQDPVCFFLFFYNTTNKIHLIYQF